MALENSSKIQNLLAAWPNGTAHTSVALRKLGYSDFLLYHYRRSGWIQALGRGAFSKVGDVVDWRGGLYALQRHLNLSVHLGGKSALAYQGSSHFLVFGKEIVTLFAAPGTRLPSWFTQHEWGVTVTLTTTNLFPDDTGIITETVGNFSIRVSSRERAMFEALHGAPQSQSLSEARLLMGALTNLRPALVQRLLERCASIKVKRLFMVLAEDSRLPWIKKLDLKKVDFGSGDITVVKGGKLHPQYRVTLPKEFFEER